MPWSSTAVGQIQNGRQQRRHPTFFVAQCFEHVRLNVKSLHILHIGVAVDLHRRTTIVPNCNFASLVLVYQPKKVMSTS